MGLTELKFLYKTAFAGEVIVGAVVAHGLIVISREKSAEKVLSKQMFIDEKEFYKWLI